MLNRRLWGNIALILISTLVTLLLVELGVRLAFPPDEDGNVQILGDEYNINAHQIRVEGLRRSTQDALVREFPILVNEPNLGWTNNPELNWHTTHLINAQGMRSPVDIPPEQDPGVLRIGLFGDSFTYGSEVAMSESWGYILQHELNERGIPAEVLNFGVGSYGIDQAYLRWLHEGKNYDLDIVIFGFTPVDIPRNQSIFISLREYSNVVTLPYTKPRFVLEPDNTLTLVNQPTMPLQDVAAAYANWPQHPLYPYEAFYIPPFRSRLSMLTWYFAAQAREPARIQASYTLTEAIIRQFASEVEADGSAFIMTYLPGRPFVQRGSLEQQDFAPMIASLAADMRFWNPEVNFGDWQAPGAYAPGGHMGPVFSRDIALYLVERIEACLNQPGCFPDSLTWDPDATTLHDPALAHIVYYSAPQQDGTIARTFSPDLNPDHELLPLMGDWNGDGTDTIGFYDRTDNAFILYPQEGESSVHVPTVDGAQGNLLPLAGDWDGDGTDGVGLFNRREGYFWLRETATDSVTSLKIPLTAGAIPLAGDWNGDGMDTVAVFDEQRQGFGLIGEQIIRFRFLPVGNNTLNGYLPIAGDWDGDGVDTVGLYNEDTGIVGLAAHNETSEDPSILFDFEMTSRQIYAVAGDWNGDGRDAVAAYVR